jgi:hypothetical protein
LALALFLVACATEEQVEFGDPDKFDGSFNSDLTGPGDCSVNNACGVSWSNRVHAAIFAAPFGGSEPSGGCGAPACHDEGAGGLLFPSDDADEAYFRLTSYELVGGRPYIVPCHPELSHLMCNLKFADGTDNPYVGEDEEFSGGCGSPMPKPDENVPAEPLNQDQLEDIAEWIACGAPQN